MVTSAPRLARALLAASVLLLPAVLPAAPAAAAGPAPKPFVPATATSPAQAGWVTGTTTYDSDAAAPSEVAVRTAGGTTRSATRSAARPATRPVTRQAARPAGQTVRPASVRSRSVRVARPVIAPAQAARVGTAPEAGPPAALPYTGSSRLPSELALSALLLLFGVVLTRAGRRV